MRGRFGVNPGGLGVRVQRHHSNAAQRSIAAKWLAMRQNDSLGL